tara:strand:- start:439 stop:1728 length:1290 start_codon:yes stop_codon:yes gene_type:complete
MNGLEAIRGLILNLTRAGGEKDAARDARRLAIGAIKAGGDLPGIIEQLNSVERSFNEETGSWVRLQRLTKGEGGPFDACDLRCWLALASLSNVPFIPAEEILTLSEDEAERACGRAAPISPTLRARLTKVLSLVPRAENAAAAPSDLVDDETLQEKLFAAMDGVQSGWMVRHVRAGASGLKALAGCGLAGPEVPEVRFNSESEEGPGWIREGNRRKVDLTDKRIIMVIAEGPPGPTTFVKRPWVKSARWVSGEDPHRAGSPIAGPGLWPAEWRAFVENGKVLGVAFYYAWAGSATPENAAQAFAVRNLAQRLVDQGLRQGAIPRFMNIEFARASRPEIDARFPRDGFACTLDFIETDDGLQLLEGGPACTPIGGGHPCAFAGIDPPVGVAFRPVPGISIAEPETWGIGAIDSGCVMSWDEAADLARGRS